MATSHSQSIGKWALAPSLAVLTGWAFVPLAIAIYFAFLRYNLQNDNTGWMGLDNGPESTKLIQKVPCPPASRSAALLPPLRFSCG